jgi:uncharacterized protein YdgA (DUF945 family)
MKLKQLGVDNKMYSDLVLDLSINNLDANIMSKINRKIRVLQEKTNPTRFWILTLLPDLPALLSKGAQVTVERFEIVTNTGPLKIDLNLALPNENYTNIIQVITKINGQSHVLLTKAMLSSWLNKVIKKSMLGQAHRKSISHASGIPAVDAPDRALQSSELSTKTLAKQDISDAQVSLKVSKKIQDWVNEGVLIKKGDDYLLLFDLKDGKLFINGHPFTSSLLAA